MSRISKNKLSTIAVIVADKSLLPRQMFNKIKKVLESSSTNIDYLFKLVGY